MSTEPPPSMPRTRAPHIQHTLWVPTVGTSLRGGLWLSQGSLRSVTSQRLSLGEEGQELKWQPGLGHTVCCLPLVVSESDPFFWVSSFLICTMGCSNIVSHAGPIATSRVPKRYWILTPCFCLRSLKSLVIPGTWGHMLLFLTTDLTSEGVSLGGMAAQPLEPCLWV